MEEDNEYKKKDKEKDKDKYGVLEGVCVEKRGDVGDGEEEEHKNEEDGKGKNKGKNDEEKLPLTQMFCLSTGGKVLVEGKKRIPLCFDISPYPYYVQFTISPFNHFTK